MSLPMPLIKTIEELRERVREYSEEDSFARQERAAGHKQANYWVYDPLRAYFAPARYVALLNRDDEHKMTQSKDGNQPQVTISGLGIGNFVERPDLHELLTLWGERFVAGGVKSKAKRTFVELPLPSSTESAPAALPTNGLTPLAYSAYLVAARKGQAAFRNALLADCRDCCVVSGCNLAELLEAAHIDPYMDINSQSVDNGWILRADLHTLFDRHLLGFHPESLTVHIHPLAQVSGYGEFENRSIAPRAISPRRPDAMRRRWTLFQTRLASLLP